MFKSLPRTSCCVLWTGHLTLTAPLSTEVLYTNGYRKFNAGGNPARTTASYPGGNRNTPSHFMLQKQG